MNYYIKHNDIAGLGYYFGDNGQEDRYLESVNEELAVRVGGEICKILSPDMIEKLSFLPDSEIFDYLTRHIPGMHEIINKTREDLLEEIGKRRKDILLNNMIHSDSA